jgi:hypothetical protein
VVIASILPELILFCVGVGGGSPARSYEVAEHLIHTTRLGEKHLRLAQGIVNNQSNFPYWGIPNLPPELLNANVKRLRSPAAWKQERSFCAVL